MLKYYDRIQNILNVAVFIISTEPEALTSPISLLRGQRIGSVCWLRGGEPMFLSHSKRSGTFDMPCIRINRETYIHSLANIIQHLMEVGGPGRVPNGS